jgi:hypothetical protein
MGQLSTIFRNYQDAFGFLAAEGYMYRFSGATLATTTTGPQAYATTTPTFCLAVDAGTQWAVIPAEARIFQAGTVGGGAVTVLMEIDNADRYTSGGTALLSQNAKTNGPTLAARVGNATAIAMFDCNSTAITATDAVGIRTFGALLGQDVSPAEGAVNEIIWTPQAGIDILAPTATLGASWLINTSTSAGAGLTCLYSFKAAVVPLSWL